MLIESAHHGSYPGRIKITTRREQKNDKQSQCYTARKCDFSASQGGTSQYLVLRSSDNCQHRMCGRRLWYHRGWPLGMFFGGAIAVTVAAFVTPVIVVTMRLLNGTTVAPVPAMLLGATSGFASGFIAVWILDSGGRGSFQLELAAFAAVAGALGGCLGANRLSKAARAR
jgi:hypothetical protein